MGNIYFVNPLLICPRAYNFFSIVENIFHWMKFLKILFLNLHWLAGKVSNVALYSWCSGGVCAVFESKKMEWIAVKFWVMSCLPPNGGIGVICYKGFCGFALKLRGGLSCWGGFFRKLWKCAVLMGSFVCWSHSVDFWVFSGVVYRIVCIVMDKNIICCGWSVCILLRSIGLIWSLN